MTNWASSSLGSCKASKSFRDKLSSVSTRERADLFRAVALGLLICPAAICADVNADLVEAIRRANVVDMGKALDGGAGANARVLDGTPVLMLSVLQADTRCVRLLLDRGADPNASDDTGGSTALMWAIPDQAKVELLLARGALVNTASKSGSTPLLIAAGRPGAGAIVRLLLARGANMNARDVRGRNVVMRAAFGHDLDILRLVLARGGDSNSFDEDRWTPLMEAGLYGDTAMSSFLLARRADVNRRDTDGASALIPYGPMRSLELHRKLLANGADAHVKDNFGRTLLITAAASDTTAPEGVRGLLAAGHDPTLKTANLHTKAGESALDWARKHGDTPVTRALFEHAHLSFTPLPNPELPRLHAGTPHGALAKALPLLLSGGPGFIQKSGCVSCHHHSLPSLAFSIARQKGVELDERQTLRHSQSVQSIIRGARNLLLDDIRIPGGALTSAYIAVGLAADDHAPDLTSDALIHHLAGNQLLDGSWSARADRPPLEYGRTAATALTIRALRLFPLAGRQAEFDRRISRAANWLRSSEPKTTEEEVFRLLGLVWAGGDQRIFQSAVRRLVSSQRPDGGWGQLPSLLSDAYASGQVLFALSTAGLPVKGANYQRGVQFLLQTQLIDGSWLVHSRSFPIQPKYFETGFPHGANQWISAAGTSWACIAIALSL